MVRIGPPVNTAAEWIDATPHHPCPICYGVEGCSTLRDAGYARCVEWPSEWPLVAGGWLHRIEIPRRHPVSGPSPGAEEAALLRLR